MSNNQVYNPEWWKEMVEKYGLDIRKAIYQDLSNYGINARVKFSDVNKVQIIFRSEGDMNLYKVVGYFANCNEIGQGLMVEFKYGWFKWFLESTIGDILYDQ